MTRLSRFVALLLAVVSVLFVSAEARAQNAIPENNGKGFDTHLFRPAMDSKGFFHTNGTDIIGKNDISFGLVIDYGTGILRVPDKGQDSARLVDHSFQGTFSFNYGLLNTAVLGLTLPVNLMQGQEQIDKATPPNATQVGPLGGGGTGPQWFTNQLDGQHLQFIALHGKIRILRVEKAPIGLAAAVQVGLPTGDASKNAGGDPSFWYWPQLIAEKRLGSTGQFKIGANVGYRGHSASDTIITLRDNKEFRDGSRVTYGAALAYRILEPVDLVVDTYATFLLASKAAGSIKPSNEITGGVKVFVERNSYLMLGAGPRYTNGFEAADFRAFIGFIFEPSIGDRDGDGLKDDVDKCPDEPEDFDGFQDEDGCPDPDNDNDGILDKDDRCPDVPEDRDGDQDEDGCPEGSDGDRDGDGIPDSKDKCPDQPEDKDGFQDKDGCPDPDNDQDGIPDKQDRCPNDPEDKDGFEDKDGCPDPDNDKDGILDVNDKCPNEPETYNGYQDEDGCPDKGNVIIEGDKLVILKKIKFKVNSAEILPESNEILDAVATTVIHHPEFTLLEVAGHADERADDNYNLKLTQDRVNSVMSALIARKVDRTRLRAKGYGEYCPEDPAHNEEAWEKNRRVEFKIVKTKDGPTGVELGCDTASRKGVKPDAVPP